MVRTIPSFTVVLYNYLQNDWERITDRSIQKNTVQRRVKDMISRKGLELDSRREKLVLANKFLCLNSNPI